MTTGGSAAALVIDGRSRPTAGAGRPPVSGDESSSYRLTGRFVERGGMPVIPVSGEMHFSRVPRSQWRDRLNLMKAGGITVVATYVFWRRNRSWRRTPNSAPRTELVPETA